MDKDQRKQTNDALQQALVACARGDKSAFRVVYDLTYPAFHAITQRKLSDPDLADDVLQRTYVSIWKACARYDSEKSVPFTWMLVILRNRTIDVIRSRKHVDQTSELHDGLVDTTAERVREIKSYFLKTYLAEYIARLPTDMARAILLNVVQGHTSKEVGEIMRVPQNTAKSWIRRGLLRV